MIIRHTPFEYMLLVQGRPIAKGDMGEMAEKAIEWAKLIVDVRIEPVKR